jgi:hypothetical protein
MIGGTAYAAGKAGQRNAQREQSQEERIQELEAQQAYAATPPPAAPAGAAPVSLVDQLTQLASLRDTGVLTTDEFEAAKAKLLAG